MRDPRGILVLGGARSGKSLFAERIAASLTPPVVYVATLAPADAEMHERVARHRDVRPKVWETVEAPIAVAEHLRALKGNVGTLLVDSVTLLVSSHCLSAKMRNAMNVGGSTSVVEGAVTRELNAIWEYAGEKSASLVFVSDEVGLGIVPATRSGRLFRDVLGLANQRLAARCDEVYLLVAGLPLACKGPKPEVDDSMLV